MSGEAKVVRDTKETSIQVSVNINGSGKSRISSSHIFLDHLLVSLAKHSGMDIQVRTKSRDGILHHAIEDTAIVLGKAICEALGDRNGISRFGHALIPMDESLAQCTLDLVRRPYHVLEMSLERESVEGLSSEDIRHFFESLLIYMEACVHLRVIYGSNDHHKAEAAIKSLAVAMRDAVAPRGSGTPSTKGIM